MKITDKKDLLVSDSTSVNNEKRADIDIATSDAAVNIEKKASPRDLSDDTATEIAEIDKDEPAESAEDVTESAINRAIEMSYLAGKTPKIKYKKNYVSVNGRKFYYDDDGRTVAPMNVDGLKWYTPTEVKLKRDQSEKILNSMSKKEARSFTCGALSAALLIAAVFIAGLGVLIWFLTAVWS